LKPRASVSAALSDCNSYWTASVMTAPNRREANAAVSVRRPAAGVGPAARGAIVEIDTTVVENASATDNNNHGVEIGASA
jgi:hypothetical protein